MCIPSVWRHGTIVPIPKSKTNDPRIPLKNRGISLLSISYKAFCTDKPVYPSMDRRHGQRTEWIEVQQKLFRANLRIIKCRLYDIQDHKGGHKVHTSFLRDCPCFLFPCQECNDKMEGSLGVRLGFSLIPTHKQGKLGNQSSWTYSSLSFRGSAADWFAWSLMKDVSRLIVPLSLSSLLKYPPSMWGLHA